MYRTRKHLRPVRIRTAVIGLALLAASLGACQPQWLRDEKTVGRQDIQIAQLEDAVGRQKTRIMELELRLLSKESEIEKLSATQEQAIQEVVRVTAKLRSRNSKAETVADLAEVKLALDGLQTKTGSGNQSPSVERARQYLSMSEEALESGNVDGASYLIGQAKSSIRVAGSSSDEHAEDDGNMTAFSQPVSMTVVRKSNVRTGPGLDKKVLYQLDPGVSVSALGYQGLWVQIQDTDKSIGWIHYSLLKATPQAPPQE